MTTFAGSTTGSSGSSDGTGTLARFNQPSGIVVDSSGTNIYVVDYYGHDVRRIVISTGER